MPELWHVLMLMMAKHSPYLLHLSMLLQRLPPQAAQKLKHWSPRPSLQSCPFLHTVTLLTTHRRSSLSHTLTTVAVHFCPLITGHPACMDAGSCVPSDLTLKNNKASPRRGLTATRPLVQSDISP